MATADYPRDAVPLRSDPSSVESGAILRRSLDRLAARRNARQMISALARSLAVGTGLSAVLVLCHRAYLIDLPLWLPIAIVALSFVVGWIDGARRHVGAFDAALDADRVLGLRERLSSAIAFAQPELLHRHSAVKKDSTKKDSVKNPKTSGAKSNLPASGAKQRMTPFGARISKSMRVVFPVRREYQTASDATPTSLVPALVQDAARRAQTLDPKTVYPARLDRSLQVLIVTTVALAAFAFMPDMAFLRTPEQRAQAKVLATQGKALEAVAKQVREKKEIPEDAAAKKMARRLSALGQKMQRGRMTKREALVSMGQLRKDLDKAVQNDNKGSGVSNLEQVERALREESMESAEGRQMQQELAKGDRERAADKLEALAEKIDKGDMTEKERQAAANDLEKAAKALRDAGNEDAADKLDQAAKNLRSQQGGQQGQQKQGQNGQQGQQNQQGQGAQKQGKQGQQSGQGQQSQQGQQGKQNQQGQQGKSGSQSGQQGQQGQQQGGQKQGGQQGGQSGQQGQQNGQSGSQNGSQGSGALRNLAKGLRGGGTMGNSQGMQDMLKKIEQAEKDTGQNNGQQGDGKSGGKGGQGQSGQGQGQAMTPGKDLQPTDPTQSTGGGPGLGPRGNIQGGQKSGGGVSRMKTNRTGDKRHWADEWSDRLPKTRKKLDRITGKMGSSGEVEQLPTRTEAKGGQVNTPYYDVYENSRKDAEDAVSREQVPPALKQPVKDYFDSLKPDKR